MLFICTFWSASVSIFSFSYCKKGIWAFAQNTVIEAVFILGTILGTEIMRTISISVSGMDNLAPITPSLCLLLSLINPLAAYMGYYGNITGDSGLMNLYCGRIGIDSSTQAFSFLFYKAASIMSVSYTHLYYIPCGRLLCCANQNSMEKFPHFWYTNTMLIK